MEHRKSIKQNQKKYIQKSDTLHKIHKKNETSEDLKSTKTKVKISYRTSIADQIKQNELVILDTKFKLLGVKIK